MADPVIIALDQLLTGSLDITANNELLWQELSQLPLAALDELSRSTTDKTALGWLQLVTISKIHVANLEAQQRGISNWVKQNPDHPARSGRRPAR